MASATDCATSTSVLYQPAHGTARCGHPRLNYVSHIDRLIGMSTDELVEMSQDCAVLHELVVACADPQSPN